MKVTFDPYGGQTNMSEKENVGFFQPLGGTLSQSKVKITIYAEVHTNLHSEPRVIIFPENSTLFLNEP